MTAPLLVGGQSVPSFREIAHLPDRRHGLPTSLDFAIWFHRKASAPSAGAHGTVERRDRPLPVARRRATAAVLAVLAWRPGIARATIPATRPVAAPIANAIRNPRRIRDYRPARASRCCHRFVTVRRQVRHCRARRGGRTPAVTQVREAVDAPVAGEVIALVSMQLRGPTLGLTRRR
jgi:hypothetical protein